uniref:Vesicle transport protein n=1 Tax=Chlamydomonas euryale TaxID=1486919 RepID=A0A7R9YT22_9CHLO|mmetsp:Transcript_17554/g.52769  ORF Transcript_17554/g.52769 Transcript_17554/m.52769 type:complete len:163 (+) Transcript_17554:250-738(+)
MAAIASDLMHQVKQATRSQDSQERSLLQDAEDGCNLSWKERFIGFGVCVASGIALSIISIPFLWIGNIALFAILYSVGSVTSIASTMFLMGPLRQIQRMFENHRIYATVTFLAAIVATLLVAFLLENAALCIVLLVIQMCALAWYCITWIPGAQTAVASAFK